jgi:hypothetical protein
MSTGRPNGLALGPRADWALRALTALLVTVLGLVALVVGALEIFAGARLAYSAWLVLVGGVNVLFCAPHIVASVGIVRRRRYTREFMLWLAAVGFLWCSLRALLLGGILQIALLPLYIVVGILAVRTRSVFSPQDRTDTEGRAAPPGPHPEKHGRAKTPPTSEG